MPVAPPPLELDLTPTVLNLKLYAGDDSPIELHFDDEFGMPQPLTGTCLAQLKVSRTDATPAVTAFVDMSDADAGRVTFIFAGADLAALVGSSTQWTGVWDIQVVDWGWTPLTGNVTVGLDVSR